MYFHLFATSTYTVGEFQRICLRNNRHNIIKYNIMSFVTHVSFRQRDIWPLRLIPITHSRPWTLQCLRLDILDTLHSSHFRPGALPGIAVLLFARKRDYCLYCSILRSEITNCVDDYGHDDTSFRTVFDILDIFTRRVPPWRLWTTVLRPDN